MDSTLRWGVTQSHPILMIPGPTELPFPVVQAMNQPATIQYDMNFDVKVLEPVTLALRDIFQTSRGEVIAMPARAAPRLRPPRSRCWSRAIGPSWWWRASSAPSCARS